VPRRHPRKAGIQIDHEGGRWGIKGLAFGILEINQAVEIYKQQGQGLHEEWEVAFAAWGNGGQVMQ
jgi:hypothetical protein